VVQTTAAGMTLADTVRTRTGSGKTLS